MLLFGICHKSSGEWFIDCERHVAFLKIYLKKRMNFSPTDVLRQNRTTKETEGKQILFFLLHTERKKLLI